MRETTYITELNYQQVDIFVSNDKHEEIFYKMYRQGFQRGWKAGGYVVYDLMNHILGEEVMTSSDMWHKMHVVLDHTETKQ